MTPTLTHYRSLTRTFCLVFFLTLAGAPAAAEEFRGTVVGVADGDSISVLRDGRAMRVRLNGIDAPEKGQPFGERAKQFTSSLAFGQIVTVRVKGKDQHERLIADVILPDGRNLNQEAVRAGFAWWFRRYSTDQSLGELEADARAAKRGLWADPNPVPPWEWRQAQRETAPAPAAPRDPPVVAAPSTRPTEAPVIGNKRSHVYHKTGCPGYNEVSPANRVPFSTPAEAEAAGYRLAGDCR